MNAILSRRQAAVCGVVAAIAGTATGHALALVTRPASSPVLAVGNAVVDRSPTAVKDWAISHLGPLDKPLLLLGIVVVTLALAALTGLAYRRSPVAGLTGQAILVAAAGLAVASGTPHWAGDLGPVIVTEVVAAGVLIGLAALASARAPASAGGPDRRSVLRWAGGVTVASLAIALLARRVRVPPDTAGLSLPPPDQWLPPLPRGLSARYRGISPLRTPNDQFYRVDIDLTVPVIDRGAWRLRIDGDVRHPLTVSYADLTRMHVVERDVTLTCVSDPVGGPYVGGARWLGVRVRDLLDRAGVIGADRPGMRVISSSADGFTISTPLGPLTDDRDALLAFGMNGVPLPPAHGFPARLVTPGIYGMVGSTKWVTRLHVTTDPQPAAYWTQRGWAATAPIKPSARIDTPTASAQVGPGTVVLGGVAWAQQHGVVGVQVRVDDGPWQPAVLGPRVGIDYWRQWYRLWHPASPGPHTIAARVVYGHGRLQSAASAPPFPSGASGYPTVQVVVRS